jgi:uncharacterized membrane protein
MSDDLYSWLLFAHVLAAMVWVGGAVLLGVLAIRVARDGEPGGVGRFMANMRVIGPLVLAPATVAVAGFGVWLCSTAAPGTSASSGFSSRWRCSLPRS